MAKVGASNSHEKKTKEFRAKHPEGRKAWAERKRKAGIKPGHAGGAWAEKRVKQHER